MIVGPCTRRTISRIESPCARPHHHTAPRTPSGISTSTLAAAANHHGVAASASAIGDGSVMCARSNSTGAPMTSPVNASRATRAILGSLSHRSPRRRRECGHHRPHHIGGQNATRTISRARSPRGFALQTSSNNPRGTSRASSTQSAASAGTPWLATASPAHTTAHNAASVPKPGRSRSSAGAAVSVASV